MENKNIPPEELLIFHEWSNAVRISQEPSRSRIYRMRKKVNEVYHKYSNNIKARLLINQMDSRLEESLGFNATAATILPII